MELPPGTIVDRYVIEEPLGEGGMGRVYRARHRSLGTLHALKVLHRGGEELHDRLVQEGRLQGSLQHPGVLRVTDLVEVGDRPALVLEYVDGESLAERLARGRLPPERAGPLAWRLMQAVAAAHAHGLIHRDLKPGNVLLAEVEGELHPRVADFGLAKALHQTGPARTATGASFGTPAYMAPEQFRDASSVDERADVFSMGAILYELATGSRAFVGDSAPDVMWRTVRGDFQPPRSLEPALPEAWERAIVGALEPNVQRRIPSMRRLMEVWSGEAWAPAPSPPTADLLLSPAAVATLEPAGDPTLPEGRGGLASLRAAMDAREPPPEEEPPSAPPDRRAALKRGAVGAGLGVLGAVVFLAAITGGLKRIIPMMGPWWPPALVLCGVSGARMALGLESIKRGRPGMTSWLLAPTLLVVVGVVGCNLGIRNAWQVVGTAATITVPSLVARGLSISVGAWAATELLVVPQMLAIVGLVAWGRRAVTPAPKVHPFPLVLALGVGLALWLAEAALATERGATLVIYATLVAAGGMLALVPDASPEDGPSRLLAGVAAATAVATAAFGVHIQELHQLFWEVGMAWEEAPRGGLAAAGTFAELWERVQHPWSWAWLAAGALLWIGFQRRTRAGPALPRGARRSLAELAALILLLLLPAWGWSKIVVFEFTQALTPAWEAASVAVRVPALHLGQSEGELVVVFGAGEPLVPGDELLGVSGRTVHGVGDVMEILDEHPPGSPVAVTVDRQGRLLELALPWEEGGRE